MNEEDKAVLDHMEAVLKKGGAKPREVIDAAYRLGQIDGQLTLARITESALGEFVKELPQ